MYICLRNFHRRNSELWCFGSRFVRCRFAKRAAAIACLKVESLSTPLIPSMLGHDTKMITERKNKQFIWRRKFATESLRLGWEICTGASDATSFNTSGQDLKWEETDDRNAEEWSQNLKQEFRSFGTMMEAFHSSYRKNIFLESYSSMFLTYNWKLPPTGLLGIYLHLCMYGCMYVCMYLCMSGCMYVCMHACMHANIWLYIFLYVYMRT